MARTAERGGLAGFGIVEFVREFTAWTWITSYDANVGFLDHCGGDWSGVSKDCYVHADNPSGYRNALRFY
jgi:hypothetical protein